MPLTDEEIVSDAGDLVHSIVQTVKGTEVERARVILEDYQRVCTMAATILGIMIKDKDTEAMNFLNATRH